jgi:hypothetical protein
MGADSLARRSLIILRPGSLVVGNPTGRKRICAKVRVYLRDHRQRPDRRKILRRRHLDLVRGRWRIVARTTKSTGEQGIKSSRKNRDRSRLAPRRGKRRPERRSGVPAPPWGPHTCAVFLSSEINRARGQPAGPEPAWHGYQRGSAPGLPRRRRADHREHYGRLRSHQPSPQSRNPTRVSALAKRNIRRCRHLRPLYFSYRPMQRSIFGVISKGFAKPYRKHI